MSAARMSPGDGARRTASGLASLTLLTGSATAMRVHTPVLLLLTVAFVLTAPGWVIASRFLRITQPALLWSAATGLGLTLGILLAQVMVSSGWWHPWATMLGFEAVTLAALLYQAVPGRAGRR